jgi:predicted ATPase
VHDIVLEPLTLADLQRLIADSLHCELEQAAPLAQLVHEKTAGNPFFAIQFVFALAEEELLTFDRGAESWCCTGPDRHKQIAATKRPEGIDRLAQGQSGKGSSRWQSYPQG